MNFLSSIFAAISSFFAWATNRSTLKNATEIKTAKKAQDEVDLTDRTIKAIAKKDINEIRKELSE